MFLKILIWNRKASMFPSIECCMYCSKNQLRNSRNQILFLLNLRCGNALIIILFFTFNKKESITFISLSSDPVNSISPFSAIQLTPPSCLESTCTGSNLTRSHNWNEKWWNYLSQWFLQFFSPTFFPFLVNKIENTITWLST